MPLQPAATLAVLSLVTGGAISCTVALAHSHRATAPAAARTHPPAFATSVLAGGTPEAVAAGVARQLFASAPVAVVASANRPADLAAAITRAEQAHAPLLLTAPRAGQGAVSAVLRGEISALHPRAVLAVAAAGDGLAARLPGVRVLTNPAGLPVTGAPAPLAHVVVLVHRGDRGAATMAAVTTAQVAGARVVRVDGDDPRADGAAITALAAARPRQVLAIGAGFGPVERLAARIAVAVTGVQLPGGGQILFPGHRLVALYGHPGAPGLGALGQQDLPTSIERARKVAASYRSLSRVPVVPAFEIIASVAQGARAPGEDRSYSRESPVQSLRPWVNRATAAGMYVVLDLQPGRASLLAQAKSYQPLLSLPNVGLALDPEWKLQPGQMPLRQIGGVSAAEINSVITWLAGLGAQRHLPQKLLVLHEFRLSMIGGERRLDLGHDDLAIIIHMDGQGTPAMKRSTWNAVTQAAPAGVSFGWKDFFTKDHPMLSPRQTMVAIPRPVMISYQ